MCPPSGWCVCSLLVPFFSPVFIGFVSVCLLSRGFRSLSCSFVGCKRGVPAFTGFYRLVLQLSNLSSLVLESILPWHLTSHLWLWAGSENFGAHPFVSQVCPHLSLRCWLLCVCCLNYLFLHCHFLSYCYLSLGVLITHGNRVLCSSLV